MINRLTNRKTALIQTKVSPQTEDRLNKICDDYNFSSKYEIIQYLISAFLKYADPEGEADGGDVLPIELAKIFEDLQNKQELINSVAPSAARKFILSEAINLYQSPGSTGTIAAKYTFSANGDYMKTQSNSQILRTVLVRLFPSMAKSIKSICVSLGNVSYDEAISYLIEQVDGSLKSDGINREIKTAFDSMGLAEKHVDIGGNIPKQTRNKNISNI